ncbi:MAG TPA: apolipoprotein N-acyltransferase [Planctomycetota bacterium]|nr:apolipoprotein N-acyltransferase [Planctomycetota bacterium]
MGKRLSLLTRIRPVDVALGAASGLMLFLSFPPAGLYPVAWVAAVPLLWLAARGTKRALLPSYLAGAIFFLAGLEWVRHATTPGMILLGLFLGLYVMAFSVAAGVLRSRLRLPLAIAAPVVWVALEAIRSNIMTGFPYLLLGHSQIHNLRLMQILDVTGVYGVSFLVMSGNGLMAEILLARESRARHRTEEQEEETGNREQGTRNRESVTLPLIISAVIVAAGVGGSIVYGHVRLAGLPSRIGPEICIVQANIPQSVKAELTYESAQDMLVKHLQLTNECLGESDYATKPDAPPPLVIWPETAVPCQFNNTRDPWTVEVRANLNMIVFKRLNVKTLLIGAETLDVVDGKPRRFNSAICIDGRCENYQRYDKIHLVPFGEYIPLPNLLFFLKTLVPVGSLPYSAGKDHTLLTYEGHKIGVVICYEDVFPGLVRQFVGKGADFIVNISNEGWFYNSAEADQHLAIARCRAIENRLGLVRGTNSGISCLIDPAGRIEKVIERGGRVKMVNGWLVGRVSLGPRDAIYTRIGDLFAIICLTASAVLTAVAAVLGRRSAPDPAPNGSKPSNSRRKSR